MDQVCSVFVLRAGCGAVSENRPTRESVQSFRDSPPVWRRGSEAGRAGLFASSRSGGPGGVRHGVRHRSEQFPAGGVGAYSHGRRRRPWGWQAGFSRPAPCVKSSKSLKSPFSFSSQLALQGIGAGRSVAWAGSCAVSCVRVRVSLPGVLRGLVRVRSWLSPAGVLPGLCALCERRRVGIALAQLGRPCLGVVCWWWVGGWVWRGAGAGRCRALARVLSGLQILWVKNLFDRRVFLTKIFAPVLRLAEGERSGAGGPVVQRRNAGRGCRGAAPPDGWRAGGCVRGDCTQSLARGERRGGGGPVGDARGRRNAPLAGSRIQRFADCGGWEQALWDCKVLSCLKARKGRSERFLWRSRVDCRGRYADSSGFEPAFRTWR